MALRAWAEADPPTAATLILHFAGPGFDSARMAAGLLLQADLRPDDRILVLGHEPAWLPQAINATQGRTDTKSATVLIADQPPEILPPNLRRMILIGGAAMTLPPGITLSRPEDWTYPRESSAD
jgi:hypothetical protein